MHLSLLMILDDVSAQHRPLQNHSAQAGLLRDDIDRDVGKSQGHTSISPALPRVKHLCEAPRIDFGGSHLPSRQAPFRPILTTVQATTTEMGRLVADAGKRDWDELTAEYGAMLMEGLGVMGTLGKHVNVLQHLMGYLKNHLSSEDKAYRR